MLTDKIKKIIKKEKIINSGQPTKLVTQIMRSEKPNRNQIEKKILGPIQNQLNIKE